MAKKPTRPSKGKAGRRKAPKKSTPAKKAARKITPAVTRRKTARTKAARKKRLVKAVVRAARRLGNPKVIPIKPSIVPQAPEAQLRDLSDRYAICDLMFRHARALDRLDLELLKSCYTPDGTEDRGAGMFQGRVSELVAWIADVYKQIQRAQHFISNVRIDLAGNIAHVESYFFAFARIERQGGMADDVIRGGRYLDKVERMADGTWKIAHRKVVYDWARTVTASDPFLHLNPEAHWGVRGSGDLSYKMHSFPGTGKQAQYTKRTYTADTIKF